MQPILTSAVDLHDYRLGYDDMYMYTGRVAQLCWTTEYNAEETKRQSVVSELLRCTVLELQWMYADSLRVNCAEDIIIDTDACLELYVECLLMPDCAQLAFPVVTVSNQLKERIQSKPTTRP